MAMQFCLPDLGEGIHEAEILAIHVQPGQSLTEGEPFLEVETDKAAVDIPSPRTGVVAEILVKVGDTVSVGDTLVLFADETAQQPATVQEAGEGTKKRPVPASPSTRRLARELDVDLHQVTPTGPKGLVTADDVRRTAGETGEKNQATEQVEAVSRAQPEVPIAEVTIPDVALPQFELWGEVERQPFRSIRRATARKMTQSWNTIPHVNCQDEADVTLLEKFRQKHKDEVARAGGRLTMTVFAMKMAATALKAYPHFNASLDPAREEIVIKHYFHIGVAVDTPHGLVVPVIRDVDRKSIRELSIEHHQAVARARERKSSREELVGGTSTINNARALGGGSFTAIINHPEIAILGLGRARMKPAVVTGSDGVPVIEPRLLMPVILCFDHRVVDGGDAVRFLQVLISGLEDPDELLMSMT